VTASVVEDDSLEDPSELLSLSVPVLDSLDASAVPVEASDSEPDSAEVGPLVPDESASVVLLSALLLLLLLSALTTWPLLSLELSAVPVLGVASSPHAAASNPDRHQSPRLFDCPMLQTHPIREPPRNADALAKGIVALVFCSE
jgi:hypothetical protein